jgi:hypothetical protein
MGQRHEQRTERGSAANLMTGQVEDPTDQRVEPAVRKESLVRQPANQDQELGLDQGQLPVQV